MTQRLVFHSATVQSGQTLSGVTLPDGYGLTVDNGGTLLDVSAVSGANYISVEGVAISTYIEQSTLFVQSGGSTTATQIGAYSLVDVNPGGIAIDDSVLSGGYEFDYGTNIGATISAGGVLDVMGGVASAVTVRHGGLLLVESTGLIAGSDLRSGAEVQIFADGLVMSGDTVGSGAVLAVLPEPSVASATASVLDPGAILLEVGGATLSGITIEAGADVVAATVVVFTTSNQIVAAGTHLNGTKLTTGYEVVYAGGSATNTTVGSGTEQVVESGGTAVDTTILAGGFFDEGQIVSGLAVSATLHGGGEQIVDAVGALALSTLVDSGGIVSVTAGGMIDAMVHSGGVIEITDSGTASGSVLSGGGLQTLADHAKADGTQILSGGEQTVDGHALASGSVIAGGGEQSLDGGLGGGIEASGSLIHAAGVEVIRGGAIAMSSVIMSGGLQNDNGGTASGTVIEDGGLLRIEAGAAAADVTISLGGTIDYTNVAFVSGATTSVTSRNVLMVHDGGTTLELQLVGNYVGEQFYASADPGGGTYVTLSAAGEAGVAAATDGDVLGRPMAVAPAMSSPGPATAALWHVQASMEPVLLVPHQ